MARGFWITGAGAVGAAMLCGAALGHFVTTPQKPSPTTPLEAVDSFAQSPEDPMASGEPGPAVIRCTGCGPTLAERQMAADTGGWDPDGMIQGSSDPVVRDYMAGEESEPPPVATTQPPPSPAHRLAPSVERFAAGEDASPAAMPESAPAPSPALAVPAMAGQPQP